MKAISLFTTIAALCLLSIHGVAAQELSENIKSYPIGMCTPAFEGDDLSDLKTIRETGNFSKDHVSFFATKDQSGRTVSSETLKGSNVFYVFGFHGCHPCIAMAKTITGVMNSKKYDGENIKFVYVHLQFDDKEKMRNEANDLMKKHNLNFDHIVYLTREQWKDMGVLTTISPTYILVDRTGKTVFNRMGFPADADTGRDFFNDMIAPEIAALLEKKNLTAGAWIHYSKEKQP